MSYLPNWWTSDVHQLGIVKKSVVMRIYRGNIIKLKKIMNKAEIVFFIKKDLSSVYATIEKVVENHGFIIPMVDIGCPPVGGGVFFGPLTPTLQYPETQH